MAHPRGYPRLPRLCPARRLRGTHRAIARKHRGVKRLLDSCVWGGTLSALRATGFDVVWAGEWEHDPGDEEILRRALAEGRILVTLDKVFGHLAVALDRPHPAIIRLVGIAARQQAPLFAHLVQTHPGELAQGALLTAEPGRLRIRLKERDPKG